MKKFSFVIPVFQTHGFLKRCLLSIIDQDYPEWEIIVVLDGPNEEASKLTNGFIEQYQGKIKLFEIEHKGAPAARNYGVKQAIGDYLVLFDSDCSLYPGMLRLWAEAFEDHPDCDFVYGGYRFYSPNLEVYPSEDFDPYMLEVSNYISTMFPMRREIYPGQNENLKSLQDWDMWLRIVKDNGKKGYFLNEICFITELPENGLITMDSHEHWIERTKEVKRLHNIPDRDICVTSLGLPYQAIQRAKVLNADYKTSLLLMKPHEYKLIYLFGFYPASADVHAELLRSAFKNKGCKRAIQWVGTDVFQMGGLIYEANRGLVDALKEVDYHFCNSTWLQEELLSMGIKAKLNYCPLYQAERFQPKPLPEQFTIGVYHSDSNRMHFQEFLIDTARAMPDIQFKFFGPAHTEPKEKNIELVGWQDDITKLIEQCSINLRITVHDGFPQMPIHFMLMGRKVITNVKMPYADYIELFPTPQNYINAKADLVSFIRKVKNEPVWDEKKIEEVRGYYLDLCNPERFRRRVYRCLK